VKGFDVYNALEACSQHLEQFGGHMWHGNDFERRKLFPFKEAFENKYRKQSIRPATSEIDIDAEINFADITPKLTRY
jgi:single-stranded-DNA-specific exonuclease